MASYRFLTTWCLEAPIERVWDALEDSLAWPQWWKGVEQVVALEPGGDGGVGSRRRYVWKSALPYELELEMLTTRSERPHLLEGHATGELEGTGRWRLFSAGETTAVLYEWQVRTTRPWMNRIAPVARPVFSWNHDVVMRQGAEGLARLLGAPLLARS